MAQNKIEVDDKGWIYCPVCKCKTHTKIVGNTVLKNFPLFCPKCKQETLIDFNSNIQEEPDAKTQSR